MNKTYFFVAILVSFLLIGATSKESYFNSLFKKPQNETPESDKLMGKLLDEAIKTLSKEYDVYPVGVGMGGHFKKVSLSFEINKTLSKDDARLFLCAAQKLLLDSINSDEQLQPYLQNFPFTCENASVTLYLREKSLKSFHYPDISVANIGSRGLYFRTNDPDDKFKYKTTEEETFDEAAAKVEKYRAEKLSTSNSTP